MGVSEIVNERNTFYVRIYLNLHIIPIVMLSLLFKNIYLFNVL